MDEEARLSSEEVVQNADHIWGSTELPDDQRIPIWLDCDTG